MVGNVGGTHPTEMLSCVRLSLFLWGFNVYTTPKINEHLDFSVLDVSLCFQQLPFFSILRLCGTENVHPSVYNPVTIHSVGLTFIITGPTIMSHSWDSSLPLE